MNQIHQGNKVLIKSTNETGFIIDFIDGYTVRINIVETFDIDEYSNRVNIINKFVTVPLNDVEFIA
ncbi:MAG: hypothetical protein HFJ47_02450 [Clostridia bacterium]|nr:hypothetical protein [Clostridia bacterium]